MPSMHYILRWPDQTETTCYSPSLVIKDFFTTGTAYPLAEFLPRIRQATQIASDRVEAKFGFACSRANDQLADIEQRAARFDPLAPVEMLAFEDA
ncbi:hypothetical protein RD110_25785 [Rhodoferax koreense]|uniref:MSMEG_0570 family nitrogen starvation response protein n=1 Tax=Rhodoferax koreensis TaxID=1842727 RepID=A0A1P8K2F9_9BURK|nr:MSMEG_0570 family nitrogen starvation response protein [Rhodoferax koreense]APW40189.1 hypothetical protein RD110_25785 [Rhodoferax koreense]